MAGGVGARLCQFDEARPIGQRCRAVMQPERKRIGEMAQIRHCAALYRAGKDGGRGLSHGAGVDIKPDGGNAALPIQRQIEGNAAAAQGGAGVLAGMRLIEAGVAGGFDGEPQHVCGI